jgi:hypothetical protein
MTISGAISAAGMIPTHRYVILGHSSSGPGMLGCTETQVHNRIVKMQLQTMFQSVRHPCGSTQDAAWATVMIGDGSWPMGDARTAPRMARAMSIVRVVIDCHVPVSDGSPVAFSMVDKRAAEAVHASHTPNHMIGHCGHDQSSVHLRLCFPPPQPRQLPGFHAWSCLAYWEPAPETAAERWKRSCFLDWNLPRGF